MNKDKALDLALEALTFALHVGFDESSESQIKKGDKAVQQHRQAITAIKQARALDKKAENAIELGLDYEPAGGTQVSKVWWDGEKLMAKPIPLEDIYLPAPVQEPVQEPVACAVCNEVHAILDADESKIIRDAKDGYPDGRTPRTLTLQERITALCVYASDWKRWCLEKENTTPPAQPAPVQEIDWKDQYEKQKRRAEMWIAKYEKDIGPLEYAAPAAQRQWVGLTDDEWQDLSDRYGMILFGRFKNEIETKLREKNTP